MRQLFAPGEKSGQPKMLLKVLFVMAGGSRFTGDSRTVEGNSKGGTQLLRCGKEAYLPQLLLLCLCRRDNGVDNLQHSAHEAEINSVNSEYSGCASSESIYQEEEGICIPAFSRLLDRW